MKNCLWMLLFLLSLACGVFGQTPAKSLEGSWQGTLEAGGTKLRLVLTVTKSDAGAYAGKLDSLDQGATIPIDTITVNNDAVRLEIKSVAAVFEGVLNKERTELTGKFTQGGEPLPLTFKRREQEAAPPASSAAKPAPAAPQKPLSVPVEVQVPIAPTAVKAGGKTHLVYELHLTNFSREECTLTRVEVSGGDQAVLARFEGDDLT